MGNSETCPVKRNTNHFLKGWKNIVGDFIDFRAMCSTRTTQQRMSTNVTTSKSSLDTLTGVILTFWQPGVHVDGVGVPVLLRMVTIQCLGLLWGGLATVFL